MLQQKLLLQQQQEENLNIDNIIKTIPISLNINNKIVQELALYYLPYSTGFEIECFIQNEEFLDIFKTIPFLISSENDKDELRFRIPNGIKGLHCLYHISIYLKKYALLRKNSGIHYHIDCTDVYDLFTSDFINKHSDYILTELDTWNYKGSYNPRKCVFSESRNWVRFKESTKTMEFRIGEMTFDYSLLFKRIIHCNSIVYSLKNLLINPYYLYEKDNIKEILNNRIIKK